MTTETRHQFVAPRRDRLDRLVAEALPALSRSQAQRLIEQGQVQVGGVAVTRAAHVVEPDAAVEVAIPAIEVDEAAAQVPLEILYEDEHVLVVDKPWGILVHAVPGVPGLSIVDVIRARYPALEVRFVDTQIMNQLSYEVRADRIQALGFRFSGEMRRGIAETVALLRQAVSGDAAAPFRRIGRAAMGHRGTGAGLRVPWR